MPKYIDDDYAADLLTSLNRMEGLDPRIPSGPPPIPPDYVVRALSPRPREPAPPLSDSARRWITVAVFAAIFALGALAEYFGLR